MNGEILLVDKPAGISSFGVVARVRRKLTGEAEMVTLRRKDGTLVQKHKKVKVGHTGTLDPFATGLLILLIDKGTKRANEFLKLDKEYVATVRLGIVSTTGDPEGEKLVLVPASLTDASFNRRTVSTDSFTDSVALDKIVNTSFSRDNLTDERFTAAVPEQIVTKIPNKEAVEKCVEKFVGENWQRVPSFSAVKINGQRAYKLARAGKQVEMPVRPVRIYELEILEYEWPILKIRCKVSSGTYIRTLGEDIGKALGTGAYLTALRRTQVGKYRIEQAKTLGDLGIEEKHT